MILFLKIDIYFLIFKMTKSLQLVTSNTLSYINYSLYFIYLQCILFLNTIDHIVFSNMLEETNTISNSQNTFCPSRKKSYNSVSNHIENTTNYSIFDINKLNMINEYTRKEINNMEELLFCN
tara:strand:+ start:5939 stop:6304 length:366 start_codon:yes stop_codon:yes gene_type:complete